MRKGRVIVILCLSLILCFMCVTTNTFSWFNRTEESGNTLVLNDRKYNKSDKKSLSSDTGTFSSTTYMQKNGEYTEEVKNNNISTLAIESGERKCFKTEIVSTSKDTTDKTAQNVSLYLSGVKSDDYNNTYVGVNNPMRTYKNVGASESKTKNENGKKNVYVGIYSRSTTYEPSRFKLHWWKSDNTKNGDADGDADIEYLHSVEYKIANDNYHVYHAEVPWDAIGVGIKQDNEWQGGNIYLANSNFVCLRLDDNGNFNQDYGRKENVTPAGIEYFYSEASINVNGEIDLTASGNGTLVYKSDKPGIAKIVPGSDGKVYVQGVSEGDAKISVTSTGTVCDNKDGREPDTQTFTCVVHVKRVPDKLTDVPVVTNMEISKYDSKTDQNILTVYWYIKNTSSKSINVSVDKINVTL